MADLMTLRYVAEHYAQMQGLRLVPLGLVFLALAAWRDGQLFPSAARPSVLRMFGLAVILALLAALVIGAWYRRRFGVVHPLKVAAGAPALVATFAVAVVLIAVQDAIDAPFSLSLTFVAAALAYTGVAHRGLRKHYLWIAVPCLLLANAAAFGVDSVTSQVMLDLLIGGGLLVAGIGDHLVLRRVLQPPSRGAYVDAAV